MSQERPCAKPCTIRAQQVLQALRVGCFRSLMKGILQGALRGLCGDYCQIRLVITLTGAPEVFRISKQVGTLGAHCSSPAPSATYRPEPIPGLVASPAGLRMGNLLEGSPVAPNGGISAKIYPMTPALQPDIINILQSYKLYRKTIAYMAAFCFQTDVTEPCKPKQSRDLSQYTGPCTFRH